TDFITLKTADTSFRPVGLRFNNADNALYFTSIAKVEVRNNLPSGAQLPQVLSPSPYFYSNSGVIWKITHR
ncbi:MAG: hypothetical protein ACJ8MO_24115, partial [Bacillus sp. (in: firmicutes)]